MRNPRKEPPEATAGMTRTLPTASTTDPRADATKNWLMYTCKQRTSAAHTLSKTHFIPARKHPSGSGTTQTGTYISWALIGVRMFTWQDKIAQSMPKPLLVFAGLWWMYWKRKNSQFNSRSAQLCKCWGKRVQTEKKKTKLRHQIPTRRLSVSGWKWKTNVDVCERTSLSSWYCPSNA